MVTNMKINIYYGGRGLIDDPTLFVIGKMQEVLEELSEEYEEISDAGCSPEGEERGDEE